ncbi:YceI family protein [Staphylococcus durrellii]|uniref:YceI family protein n=1 Tax=Staphylococcus durrellii TaxID=2781773 RepID=UPI00189EA410|nr:YceI family protein [Staphylococcus durrellii]MBF7016318.1 polyisoprenoid-binding protein [Staphylococcus durrellii]
MTQFNFDIAHSSVEFSIKHLAISNIKGRFTDFEANLSGDINDLNSIKGNVVIKASSVNTGIEDRDQHLQGSDFFDVENYPEIQFNIKSVTDKSVTGDVTIKGETHEETFDAKLLGISKNPMNGSDTAGFVVDGKINREKYGITFNQALETGGMLLGKEVNFQVSLEFALED